MTVYNINTPTLQVDDIINFTYTGGEQSMSFQPGTYKIECWGANGGDGNSSNNNYSGGLGGYSVGLFTTTATQKVYFNIGGKGTNGTGTSNYSGGYNGGGKGRIYCGGGGGATHLAFASGKLSTLSSKKPKILIVAGGGGGGAYSSSDSGKGGDGGGISGENGTSSYYEQGGSGGTQSAGGASNASGYEGSFGKGGDCTTTSTFLVSSSKLWELGAGGGGGGYYGGGNGYKYCAAGGGGSGYISSDLTESSTSTQSIYENPDTNGNGYCRITVISLVNSDFSLNNQIFQNGDTINCDYSGEIKNITLSRGTYLLECWGSNGQNYSGSGGGTGGYSKGILTISNNTTLYIGVGGTPYNGGGSSGTKITAGGGATHIATVPGLLSSLENNQSSILMVAGGGGGAGYYDPTVGNSSLYNGGNGGGISGNNGAGDSDYKGKGGNQSAGGTAASTAGTFGQGGNSSNSTDRHTVGSGGGGFYGGGGGYAKTAIIGVQIGTGGGGSGYISSQLIDSFTENPTVTTTVQVQNSDGSYSTKTVESTNPNFKTNPDENKLGYCRITVLHSMPTCVKIEDEWRKVNEVFCKVNNRWKTYIQPTNITLSGNYKVSYNLGDEFTLENLIVQTTYADGSTSILNEYESSILEGTVLTNPGQQTVIIYKGGMFAGFNITVNAPLALEVEGDYKTEYIVNDTFTTEHLEVVALYSDNSQMLLNDDEYTISIQENTIFTRPETKNVIISATIDGIELTINYVITIKNPLDLSFSGDYKTLYNITEAVNIDNLITTLIYDDETTEEVSNVTVNPAVGTIYNTNGTKTINISYIKNSIPLNKNYHIYVRQPQQLNLSGEYATSFYIDDTFNYDNLVLTLIYDNGDTEEITDYTISRNSGTNFSGTGTETITITVVKYGITLTTTYDITIKPLIPITITGSGNNSRGFVTFNGTNYTSATTLYAHEGDTLSMTVDSNALVLYPGKITIDGTAYDTTIGQAITKTYTITSTGCTIQLQYNTKKIVLKTYYYGYITLTTNTA